MSERPAATDAPQGPVAAASRGNLRPVPLRVAGATGFVGALCILTGLSLGASPFVSELPGAWLFGTGHGDAGAGRVVTFLGMMVVYLGVVVMIGSWCEVVRTLRRHPSTPVRAVVAITAAWAAPVLVMPPLFSHDVYSYAAQGEMVSRGINPYVRGPAALGSGPFLRLVDPIWRHAHAPYGPAWERLAGGIVALAHHDVTWAVAGFRVVALIGVALIAWGVPALALSVGRDPAAALALAVLNPLVLLVLLGGAHNDALMLGLLVAGCAAARRGHVMTGLALTAMAAEVKVPALIGAVFIGWWWSSRSATLRQRLPRVAAAVGIAASLMVLIGLLSGLGWDWLGGLGNPGVVVSWGDPVTALGLTLGHAAGALGGGAHSAAYVRGARALGLALATVVSIGLVLRTDRFGAMQALGCSLLAFVVLGPVVWPWYETWGFVFLAVIAEGWTLVLLLALSAVACFADLPGARYVGASEPALAVLGWTVLAAVVVAYGMLRLLPSVPGFATNHVPSRIVPTVWRRARPTSET